MSTPHIGAYLKTRKYNNPGSSSKYKNRSFFSLAIHAAFIAFLLLSSLDHNGYQVYCLYARLLVRSAVQIMYLLTSCNLSIIKIRQQFNCTFLQKKKP